MRESRERRRIVRNFVEKLVKVSRRLLLRIKFEISGLWELPIVFKVIIIKDDFWKLAMTYSII